MNPLPLSDKTRSMKPPGNWDEEQHGECGTLDIHDAVEDGLPVMVSAWLPTPEEILAIMGGAPVYLKIHGTAHPVVALFAGDAPPKQ